MTEQPTGKPLSALSFEHRSEEEKARALSRPTVPDGSPEQKLINDAITHGEQPFSLDKNYITGDYLFRRLGYMGQLAPSFSHGFQNRMIHTEHVAQVAEQLCRRMGLNDTSRHLAQAIAYAHDIGHAPFSHAAEKVFTAKLREIDGSEDESIKWDHDYFGQRLLLEFAHGGVTYHGLPLTAATLEGVIKRYKKFDGGKDIETQRDVLTQALQSLSQGNGFSLTGSHFIQPKQALPEVVQRLDADHPELLHLNQWSPIEGQVAALADWLAYTVSDTRDMLLLKMHTLDPQEFRKYFENEIKQHFPPTATVVDTLVGGLREALKPSDHKASDKQFVKRDYNARMQSLITVFTHMLEDHLLTDVVKETERRYAEFRKENLLPDGQAGAVRELPVPLVSFSPEMMHHLENYKQYFKETVFEEINDNNVDVTRAMSEFFDMVEKTFEGEEMKSTHGEAIHPLTIDAGWQKAYEGIKGNAETPAAELNVDTRRALRSFIVSYITCNYTDQDVLYFVKHYSEDRSQFKRRTHDVFPAIALSGTDGNIPERCRERQQRKSWTQRCSGGGESRPEGPGNGR